MPESAPKRKSSNTTPYIIAVLVLFFSVYSLRKCLVEFSEIKSRPWAYSSDPATKLLIGTWQGEFKDHAGVEKKLTLEILVPLTKEELDRKMNRPHSRRVRSSDKRSFDGVATIQSRLGQELYTVFGSVEKSDYHLFKLDFSPEDESRRVLPNDAARSFTEGKWDADTMQAQMSFTRLDADGVSRSTSEGIVENGQVVWKENAEDKPIRVVLQRVN